jgi:hypothetical protein
MGDYPNPENTGAAALNAGSDHLQIDGPPDHLQRLPGVAGCIVRKTVRQSGARASGLSRRRRDVDDRRGPSSGDQAAAGNLTAAAWFIDAERSALSLQHQPCARADSSVAIASAVSPCRTSQIACSKPRTLLAAASSRCASNCRRASRIIDIACCEWSQ